MKEIELIVDDNNFEERLDVYISNKTSLSRSFIQKLIDQNNILVNGEVKNKKYIIKLNDHIKINYEQIDNNQIKPTKIPLNIIYEDDDVIVINKQKNLVVHPAPGNYDNTLVNGLLYYSNNLSNINGSFRPGIIHRIDKDTSGLLVCAKNNEAHTFIAKQLLDKTCYRKYYAIVKGTFDNNEGVIDAPIGRSIKDRQKMCVTDKNSKEAITEFKVLKRLSNATLLDVNLLTGRTHQIRVHMSYINHPVLNDPKYSKDIIDNTGQYLHAYYLSFLLPNNKNRVEFNTGMPEYMKEYIEKNDCN